MEKGKQWGRRPTATKHLQTLFPAAHAGEPVMHQHGSRFVVCFHAIHLLPNRPKGERADSNVFKGDRHPGLKVRELMKQFPADPDMPPDAAAQHDHYLYGTPKRKQTVKLP
jgi:hypothetical protein